MVGWATALLLSFAVGASAQGRSCTVNKGGCEHDCDDSTGVVVCICDPGFVVDPRNEQLCVVNPDDLRDCEGDCTECPCICADGFSNYVKYDHTEACGRDCRVSRGICTQGCARPIEMDETIAEFVPDHCVCPTGFLLDTGGTTCIVNPANLQDCQRHCPQCPCTCGNGFSIYLKHDHTEACMSRCRNPDCLASETCRKDISGVWSCETRCNPPCQGNTTCAKSNGDWKCVSRCRNPACKGSEKCVEGADGVWSCTSRCTGPCETPGLCKHMYGSWQCVTKVCPQYYGKGDVFCTHEKDVIECTAKNKTCCAYLGTNKVCVNLITNAKKPGNCPPSATVDRSSSCHQDDDCTVSSTVADRSTWKCCPSTDAFGGAELHCTPPDGL